MYRTPDLKAAPKERGTPRAVLRTRWLVAGTGAVVCAAHLVLYAAGVQLFWWVILGLNIFLVCSLSTAWGLYLRHRKSQGRTRILKARRLKEDLQGNTKC